MDRIGREGDGDRRKRNEHGDDPRFVQQVTDPINCSSRSSSRSCCAPACRGRRRRAGRRGRSLVGQVRRPFPGLLEGRTFAGGTWQLSDGRTIRSAHGGGPRPSFDQVVETLTAIQTEHFGPFEEHARRGARPGGGPDGAGARPAARDRGAMRNLFSENWKRDDRDQPSFDGRGRAARTAAVPRKGGPQADGAGFSGAVRGDTGFRRRPLVQSPRHSSRVPRSRRWSRR